VTQLSKIVTKPRLKLPWQKSIKPPAIPLETIAFSSTSSASKVANPEVSRRWFWPGLFSDRLALIFWTVLALVLLPRLVSFLLHSAEVITWPYQIDYDEGLNLSTSWNLAQGNNIYGVNPPDHFMAAPYPAFYFALNAIGIKIFGVQLYIGRLLSFLASLAIAVIIGWAVSIALKRAGLRSVNVRGASLVAGLLWFAPPPIFIWSTFYKQDMVAIAITVLAVTLVYYWRDSKWLWWTAPIMALAFLAKQNELLATGVGCGYMLLYNWRRGWKLLVLTLVCLVVSFGLLNLITNNGYYNHTIAYQLVPWRLDEFSLRMSRLLLSHIILIPIALACLLKALLTLLRTAVVQKGNTRWGALHKLVSDWIFLIYLCAGLFSLFTLGAHQGNYNLTLDLFPPLVIVVGIWVAQQIEQLGKVQQHKDRPATLVIGFMLVSILAWQVVSLFNVGDFYPLEFMPDPTRRAMMENLQKQIASTSGDLLTDDIYLALSAGRNVPYDNMYHIMTESENGKWDDSRFLQDLRNHRFALVLLDTGIRRFSDRAWDALNEGYEMTFHDQIDVWRSRSSPPTP
jgi:4-amino-4-deoxy-L-arabinose transferase-like glycosyltransferase